VRRGEGVEPDLESMLVSALGLLLALLVVLPVPVEEAWDERPIYEDLEEPRLLLHLPSWLRPRLTMRPRAEPTCCPWKFMWGPWTGRPFGSITGSAVLSSCEARRSLATLASPAAFPRCTKLGKVVLLSDVHACSIDCSGDCSHSEPCLFAALTVGD
jgi:hypothetical protein